MILGYFTYFLREGVLGSSLCTFSLLADEEVAALVVYSSGMAGFAGYDAPRALLAFHAVFYSLSAGPWFLASWSFGRLA